MNTKSALTLFVFIFSSIFFTYLSAQEPCGFIYVTTDGGQSTQGTKANPATIIRAVELANTTPRNHIKIQSGTYNVPQKLIISEDNITLEGGFDGQWNKTSINTNTVINIIPSLESVTIGGVLVRHLIGIEINGAADVSIRDMVINTLNTNIGTHTNRRGHSIYGIYAINSPGLYTSRLTVTTGSASDGAPPPTAANGSNGSGGVCGTRGDCDLARAEGHGGIGGIGAGNPAPSATGGAIGNQWDNSGCNRVTGVNGQNGSPGPNLRAGGNGGGGASGGRRGPGSSTPGNGGVGGIGGAGGGGNPGGSNGGSGGIADCQNAGCPSLNNLNDHGRRGANGANGNNGNSFNSAVQLNNGNFNNFYIPVLGQNGGHGAGGSGGQGGGGGGGENNPNVIFSCSDGSGNGCAGIDGSGAGGGGGGGGGQGGEGGQGGGAGGSAFALYTVNSPNYNIFQTTLNPGSAGQGTTGTSGGLGGNGGMGGFGARVTNNHGSRPTFPSCDVDWNYNGTCASNGCSSGETGAGGAGGRGGDGGNGGSGQGGTNGVSQNHHDVNTGVVASSTPISTFPVDMFANVNLGCTNSEILLSKTSSNNWNLGLDGFLSPDLEDGISSYSLSDNNVLAYYTSTGLKDVSIGTQTYPSFIQITENRPLPQIDLSVNQLCAVDSFSLSTTTSGAEYLWEIQEKPIVSTSNPTAVFISSDQNPGLISLPGAGNYQIRLKVRDECCGWSIPVYEDLTVLPSPEIYNVTGGDTICSAGSGTLVGLSNSQQGVQYQLNLNGASIGSPVSGSGSGIDFGLQTQSGSYTVTATASGGCTADMNGSAEIFIAQSPQVFTVDGGGNICPQSTGTSITLSGSENNFVYQLFLNGNPLGSGINGTGGALIFGNFNTAGTYTVQATDPMGVCTEVMNGTAVIQLFPQPLLLNLSGGGSYCAGNNGLIISLDSSEINVSYQLTLNGNPLGQAVTGTGFSLDFGLQTSAGTYSIVATSANNCIEDGFNNVVIDIIPEILNNQIASGDTICEGESPALIIGSVPTGGTSSYTYQWQESSDGINFNNISGANNENYQPGNLFTTTWYKRIVNSGICSDTSNTVQIYVQGAITNNQIDSSQFICYNELPGLLIGSLPSGGDGNYSYQWEISTDGLNFSAISGAQSPDYQPGSLTGLRYYRRVVESAGCSGISNIISISVNNELLISNASINDVNCYNGSNGSISVSLSGGTTPYNYQWSNGATSSSISGLTEGMYILTVTDEVGCTFTDSFLVNTPDSISAIINKTEVSCADNNDGTLDIVNVSGGTSPYQYSWSNGSTQSSISNLSTGSYFVTITDDKGCFKIYDLSLSPPQPTLFSFDVTDISCHDEADGSLSVNISSGLNPFQISWSNNETTETIDNLSTGMYSVEILDANNCLFSDSVFLENPNPISISYDKKQISCFGLTDGNIEVTADGGTGNLSFLWDNGMQSSFIDDLSSANYNLMVIDENNCNSEISFTISEPEAFVLSASPDTIIAKGTGTVLSYEILSGGQGSLSVLWDPADYLSSPFSQSPIASPPSTMTYTILVTDENDCLALDSVTVFVSDNLYAIPDAFVADGFNNTFFILTEPVVKIESFQVYNRWGKMLHNNSQSGWNGYYNGELQPTDTYIFRSELALPDGTNKLLEGSFLLIR
ncbi:MAG: hypothetical protein EA412_13270 [Chitinophagaceae bacterium]|nr:MAG: hypothetical protein EA412_13270 [Chitinophagaceae bacterium]